MKKMTIAAALLALTAVLAPPAGAALPKSPPTESVRCANGKTASVWVAHSEGGGSLMRLAADNRCKEWLAIYWPGLSESDPYGFDVFVAPGARFDFGPAELYEWGIRGDVEEYNGAGLSQGACVRNYETDENGLTNFSGKRVYGQNDVRDAPECGDPAPRHQSTRRARNQCGGFHDGRWPRTAYLGWKLDGKKLIKVAVHNGECDVPAVVWWHFREPRNGTLETAAVWMSAGDATDLWRSELDGLPVKTAGGKVYFGDDRTYDEANFDYNWVASGDGLACSGLQSGGCNWRR